MLTSLCFQGRTCTLPGAVVRAHQRAIIDFTPGRKPRRDRPKRQRKGASTSRQLTRLGREDQVVQWVKPPQCPAWMTRQDYEALPAVMRVRELRYRVTRPGFRGSEVTLVTTLLCPREYSTRDLAELYQSRWRIELNLRHLEQTMRMDVLRCKSVDGVTKELLAYAIAYNLVRLHMLEAARRQSVPLDRISFIDALDVLCHAAHDAANVTLVVHPARPGRDEPRVIKRPKDRYTYLTRPRDQLRQALGINHLTA